MPCFAMISGYFSHVTSKKFKFWKDICNLLIIYCLFMSIQSIILIFYGKKPHFLIGDYGLWYILSLISWRILLPHFIKIPYSVFWAFFFAIGVGYFDDVSLQMSLSRTSCFFPFFIVGYKMMKNEINIANILNKYLSIFVILISIILVWELKNSKNTLFLLWCANPYSSFTENIHICALARMARLSSAFLLCFAILSIVPKNQSFISKIGARSLNILLFQSLFILVYREHPMMYSFFDHHTIFFTLLGSLFFTFLFATNSLSTFFSPFTNPIRFLADRTRPYRKGYAPHG